MHSPLTSCQLRTRIQLQQAVRDLFAPLRSRFSPGRTRINLGLTGASFSDEVAGLEGFSRPLWGLVPLAAGGGAFDEWSYYQIGLTHGSDPKHPEFWGETCNLDQRSVEMAAIGFALASVPDRVWDPLEPFAKKNLTQWLNKINQVKIVDSNWLFFRVIVNLGLATVGAEHNPQQTKAALDRLEQFYLGDGWYSDGPNARRDYYIPIIHFYALIYAKLAQHTDPARASRFKERAAAFAKDFINWFAADGAALPYGRSLTYRFAQTAFWGALAFADVDSLPWGIVKGLLLRNLRWWARQPIFTDGGILSIGYGYPNLLMAERYNSPASPYWAMKSFLSLALPDSHAFWRSEEEDLPDLDDVSIQKHPGMIVCRDAPHDHVFALASGQYADFFPRHVAEKYAKFAYSTHFGFSVPSGQVTEAAGAHDSMLALTEDDFYFRVRHQVSESHVEGHVLYSRWHPWEDVEIETWLIPVVPWHIRLHLIRTQRQLRSLECGFALNRSGDSLSQPKRSWWRKPSYSLAVYSAGLSGVRDLRNNRTGKLVLAEPNTNLLHTRTVIPALMGSHEPGEHWLICAVVGIPRCTDARFFWKQAPYVRQEKNTVHIVEPNKNQVVFTRST